MQVSERYHAMWQRSFIRGGEVISAWEIEGLGKQRVDEGMPLEAAWQNQKRCLRGASPRDAERITLWEKLVVVALML
jgi:hypothetical protein